MLCVCLVCEQTQWHGRCIFCSTTEYQSWSNLPRLRYSLALEHRTEHGVVVESNPRKANVWSHEIVENSGSVFRSKKQRFHKSGIGTRFWEQFKIWESELQNLHDCIQCFCSEILPKTTIFGCFLSQSDAEPPKIFACGAFPPIFP